jgi:cytochrome P450
MSQAIQDSRPRWKDLDWYRTMRDSNPVWQDPQTGNWHVFRYGDSAAVLTDHTRFSSDFSEILPERAALTEGIILAMDPPRHDRMRRLVSMAFTPRAIANLGSRIAELSTDLLDRTGGRAHIELMSDFAYPLPVIVIAELLGVPSEDQTLFREWADAVLSQNATNPTDHDEIEKLKVELGKFYGYLGRHVGLRRGQPRQDLLSALATAEIDGQRLSDQEIVGFSALLLVAGHITVTILLGNAVLCLDRHPEAADALRANPDAIPDAVEEIARLRGPFSQVTRVTRAEVELGGRTIPPKKMVTVWLLSANHDERQFARPDDLVLDREPNPHLAFGRGIHFCIGAPLARLEAKIALDVLLRRYARIRVDRDQAFEEYADPGLNGVRSVHLTVEPAGA